MIPDPVNPKLPMFPCQQAASSPSIVEHESLYLYGGFLKFGVPLGDPQNKDTPIGGSILGSPYLWKLPYPETLSASS